MKALITKVSTGSLPILHSQGLKVFQVSGELETEKIEKKAK
jgi:hypothetical protein